MDRDNTDNTGDMLPDAGEAVVAAADSVAETAAKTGEAVPETAEDPGDAGGKKKRQKRAKRPPRTYVPWSTEPTDLEIMAAARWRRLPPAARTVLVTTAVLAVMALFAAGIISAFGW